MSSAGETAEAVRRAIAMLEGPLHAFVSELDDADHRMLVLCTGLLPFADGVVERPVRRRGAEPRGEPLVAALVRESVKLTGSEAAETARLLDPRLLCTLTALMRSRSHRRIQDADDLFVSPGTPASPLFGRVVALRTRPGDIAWAVRRSGPRWRVALLCSVLHHSVIQGLDAHGDALPSLEALWRAVETSPVLSEAHAARPLLTGSDVRRLLEEELPAGEKFDARLIGALLDAVLTYQFSHPAFDGILVDSENESSVGPTAGEAEGLVRSIIRECLLDEGSHP